MFFWGNYKQPSINITIFSNPIARDYRLQCIYICTKYLAVCLCVCVHIVVRIFKANKGKPNMDDVLNAHCRLCDRLKTLSIPTLH